MFDWTRFLLLFGLLASPAAAQGWLDAPLRPHDAEDGEFRALGDFEDDGDVDVLWFEGFGTSWTNVAVFLNDGNGDFTRGPLTPLAAGRRAIYGELRDVTGDGLADMVMFLAPPSGAVEVYPGVAGATFGTPISFVTQGLGGIAGDFAWGDVDDDGVAEIATCAQINFDNDALVRWWDFDGVDFVPSAAVAIAGPGTADMVAFDVNGDGLDDLVLGDQVGDELRFLPTVAGAPTSGSTLTLPLPTSTCRVYPIVGDLEGDGDLDLVVSGQCTGQWLVPVEQDPVGTFTPLAAQELTPWDWSDLGRPGAVADWDGDGDLDVLSHNGNINVGVAQRGTLALLENDGDHAFTLEAEITTAYESPREAVGTADLDSDGKPDFVALRTIAFGSGRFEDVLPRFAFPGMFGNPPDDAAVALDWEGDGDLDVFRKETGVSGGALYENDGSARFDRRFALPDPPVDHLWGGAEAIADLTGDGRPNMLVKLTTEGDIFDPPQFVEMRLLVDDGLGGFADAGLAAPRDVEISGDAKGLLIPTDIDGDSDLDLLDAYPAAAGEPGGAWINDGTGLTFLSLFAGQPLDAGDVDGDGDVDVITFEAVGPGRLVLERNETGGFSDETVFVGNYKEESVVLANLDADGDLDLALGGVGFPIGVGVYENQNGAGQFVLATTVATSVLANEWIEVGDFDGDGIHDLLTGRGPTSGGSSADHVEVLRGLGALAYEPQRTYIGRRLCGIADLDGDGDLDPFGVTVTENRSFDGPTDGVVLQRGAGTPGAGGAVPVLGASGPLRPGSTTAQVRLRRGVGGALAYLHVRSSTRFSHPSRNLAFVFAMTLSGTPGAPGEGAFDLNLAPLLSRFPGASWTLRFTIVDPGAPVGSSSSNRLDLQFGS